MDVPLIRASVDPHAIINPADEVRPSRERGRRTATYPKNLILYFTAEVLRTAKKHHEVRLVEKNWWGWLYTIKAGDSKIGLLQSGIGDSLAGLVFELLIARGVANVVAVGTAGALQRELNIGDVILTGRAVRDEGVSYHYQRPSKYSLPSARLNRRLERTLRTMNLRYAKGTIWTTDAPYRETVSDVRRFQKEGVLCVEMEAASLFSIARFRGVEVSSLHWISDRVSGPKWDPQFHTAEYDEGRDEVIEAAIRTFSG